jgi:hypothetical protein
MGSLAVLGRRGASLGVVVAILIVVAALFVARPYLPIPCTVGASGTALNITADGWGAGKACETMMNSASTNISGFAPYSTNSFGQVVCVVPLGSVTYTVRDAGLLDIFGNAVCQYLQQQTPAAKAAASAAAEASVAAASASASSEAQAQLQQEQSAINQEADAVRGGINALSAAGGPITASVKKDADNALSTAQSDLNKTSQAMQSAQSCYDAGVVQYDAGVVQYDHGVMVYVQGEEQYAAGQIKNQISALDADWTNLQSAEAVLPGHASGAPTVDQVQSAEQSANGALAQGDKTMADYLAKVQAMVNQANAYADAASKQHC